jgi:hypothetical protein
MNATLIWWAAILLEGIVLARAAFTPLLRKYPLFYLYMGSTLVIELARFCCYRFFLASYPTFYWNTEVIATTVSYGVAIEIFRVALKRHPGMARVVQRILLIVFVTALSYAATDLLHGGLKSLPRGAAELGRDLCYIEGAVLFVLLWLIGRYRISLGRNLLGLVVGYSFYLAVNVVDLALLFSPGNEFSVGLRKVLPLAYIATLVIWCITLWSPQSEPSQPDTDELDHEYETLARRTRFVLARTSTRLLRTIRP